MTNIKTHKGFGNFDRYFNQRYCKRIETVYFHYDGSGNVSALSNERGSQIAEYEYEAFGNVYSEKEVKGVTDYGFSTKEKDATGLIYFGARYYNPQIGRWITKDPMGMIDGPNVYVYVGNNPVNYIDPWGYCAEGIEPVPLWEDPVFLALLGALKGFQAAYNAYQAMHQGQDLYRQGKFAHDGWEGNNVKGDQWAKENPLTTQDYAKKYGLPKENSNPDWIAKGSYKGPSKNQPAPASHNNPQNTGGGTEVVPSNSDNVKLDWFHMP